MKFPRILNAKGDPIVLNSQEKFGVELLSKKYANAARMLNIRNSLGAEFVITTLTTIAKRTSEQKFFEVFPADYVPVVVGEGAWSSNITTYRSFSIADDFETGIINTASNSARLAVADAGVDAVNVKIYNWAKEIGWTIPELEMAAKANSWSLIEAKEKSRKKNWDLGIQRICFLGARGQNGTGGNTLGLLNQPGITTDTTTITKAIKNMTPDELKTFQGNIIETYRNNNNRTAWPTHFVIPESDYTGLANQASSQFPVKSVLEILLEAFRTMTMNPDFKILPLAYSDAAYHADVSSIASKQVYCLYRYDEESIKLTLPVDYTNTLAQTINNFQYQNAAYGQFSGLLTLRPLEMMYYTY